MPCSTVQPSERLSLRVPGGSFELLAERRESRRRGEGVEQGVGPAPVSLDREVAGLFDFGGAGAEDEPPHPGTCQLDDGVRLAVWVGADLSRIYRNPDGLLCHANFVLA